MAKRKLPQKWRVKDGVASITITKRNGEKYKVSASLEDICVLGKYRWHICGKGYAWTCQKQRGKVHSMHRMVCGFKGADHINGNPLDNRRSNLRQCTHQQNLFNKKPNTKSTSKYKGVRVRRSGQIVAKIGINGKTLQLGSFDSEKDAARAYDDAAIKYFGEYALTNKMLDLL